jgi:hemoglobin
MTDAEDLAARTARRAQIAPGTASGVDEAMIARQVHTFYSRVREHPRLGPVFAAHVEDWDAHLAKLCDFWSSVVLMTGRFKGSPMAAHAGATEIQSSDFSVWLELWRQVAREVCPPAAADLFIAKAEMIGESLRQGLEMLRAAGSQRARRTLSFPG